MKNIGLAAYIYESIHSSFNKFEKVAISHEYYMVKIQELIEIFKD